MDISNRRLFILTGMTLISFTSLVLIVSSLLLMLGVPVSGYSIPLAGGLTGAVSWWGAGQYFPTERRRAFVTALVSTTLVFILMLILGGVIMDTTWDGQTYQAEGIISIAEGWNPYYQASPDKAVFPTWLAFFSKGSWIKAASIYGFTGYIETGKVFNFLLLLASFLFSYSAITTFPNLSNRHSLVLSLLLTVNPVTLYQLFSFYVDGQLSSSLVIVIALLILYRSKPDPAVMVTLGLLSVYIINLKLSGAVYLGIIVGGALLVNWLSGRRMTRSAIGSLIIAWGISIAVVGYNPFISQYLSQFLATGNPFNPITWSRLISIEGNSPVNLVGQDPLSKFVTSLFSKSQNGSEPTQFKLPFTLYPEELPSFTWPDPRVGGFGPFFGGIIILTILLAVTQVFRRYQHRGTGDSFCLWLSALILISTLSNSEAWWARYVPQLWIIPICIVLTNLATSSTFMTRVMTRALMIFLSLNLLLIGSIHFSGTIVNQIMYWREVAEIQQLSEPIRVNFNGFVMMRFRLGLYGIAFREIDSMDCQHGRRHLYMMRAWDAVTCLP